MAKRAWLEQDLNDSILPQIKKLNDTPAGRKKAEQLCVSLRDSWSAKGLTAPNQQRGCMDQVRRTIRDELGEQHWSLGYISLQTAEYYDINHQNAVKARQRQMQQMYLKDPEAITAKAAQLLESKKWQEIVVGLAIMTGRRLSELLHSAEFKEVSKWVVRFSGAAKRRGETIPLVFDIPCLTTARRVIDAINRLRELSPESTNESREVAEAATAYFSKLIPNPPGKNGLYAHLWRSVYCTIATFWYCPKHVDDLLYKAHILGHFQTLPEDEQGNPAVLYQRLETFASDRHYRLFEIDDDVIAYHHGKRKGVKLGLAGIEALPAFRDGLEENQPMPTIHREVASIRLFQNDKDRVEALFERLSLEGTQQERMSQFLDWAEAQLEKEIGVVAEEEPEVEEEQAQTEKTAEPANVPSSLESELRSLTGTLKAFIQLQLSPTAAAVVATPEARKIRVMAPTNTDTTAQPQQQAADRSRTYRSKESNTQLVHQAIDAIISWNDAHPEAIPWAINISTLKNWVKSQPRVYAVLEERQEEIQQHHTKHGIVDPVEHNRKHHRGQDITEIVKL